MIFFVGAGPGDPDLITVKGKEALQRADVIIYAGSLVNPELLRYAKNDCQIHNSALMTREEIMAVMVKAEAEGKFTVRLHTGDTSLYSALQEQIAELEQKNISYAIIPGVSSFAAAAAALKAEYTLPGVTQSVIITRMEGKTAVPQKESLQELARHQATMVIFLSTQLLTEVVEELKEGGYEEDTPVAVVYKASWPEEKIIRGTLENIEEKVKKEGIQKTALILVGKFLAGQYEPSKLYDKTFSHEFRQAKK